MNLSELNVQEEWAYYNKVAPIQVYKLNGNEMKYRYCKKEDAKATIVVLAGGSGLADGFFLFLRSIMDKYSLITIPYMIKESHTKEIAKNIPNAKLAIVKGNHFIANKKHKAFNQEVESFLQTI